MSGKYLSYDIEIYDEIGEDFNLDGIKPSVGAFCTDIENVTFFEDAPYMSVETSKKLVNAMMDKFREGYVPFTWNGAHFDFQLLAKYSGMVEECAHLTLNHIDGMFLVVAHKGYYLSLDKALIGANIESKLHQVTLNDQTVFSNMSGSKAPLLWRQGEFSAVKEYLKYDVIQPLKLAWDIESKGVIKWTSKTGKATKAFTEMLTVKQAMALPLPDTSWMTNPVKRSDAINWIPKEILEKNGLTL